MRLLTLATMIALVGGCPTPRPVGPAVNAVIDCTIENQDQISALFGEFRTLITGQSPDWDAVYERAKQAGKSIGGCALSQIVQQYLGNRSAPPTGAPRQKALDTFEKFRTEQAGNATFHTSMGNL